ncbi:PLxRFG domain-containing protein [Variovorax sp. RCC_210]|uniref:PLxRFG domain-containing protein n=1 Tax=Variovorax sp. RCC_210 TaxID=3239217 RepID=UPI0035260416
MSDIDQFLTDATPAAPAPNKPSQEASQIDSFLNEGGDGSFARGFKTAMRQVPQTIGGTIGLVGDAVGSDAVRDYGMDIYNKQSEKIKDLSRDSDSFTNVLQGNADPVEFLKYGTGYVGGQALTALATGGVGGFVGKKVAQRGISEAVGEEAAKIAARRGAAIGAGTAVGGNNLVQEAGSIYPEAVEQAHKDGRELTGGDLARVAGAAVGAAAVDTAADALMFKGLAHGGSSAPSIIGRAARTVPTAMAREGVTEGLQTGIERWGAQQNLTDGEAIRDYVDSTALGALGGGLGGAGAAIQRRADAPAATRTSESPAEPAEEPLQLGHEPDPLVAFPDGTVGRQTDVDAYLARLPEDQRAAARAGLMGMAPQPSRPTTESAAGAPAVRAAPLPSQAMGIDPASGPLSTGAAIAVDSGAHGQLLQDAQSQADSAALAEQDQAEAANRAAPPVLDYSDLDPRDRALYDDYYRSLDRETEGHMAAALESDVPDFGARNVTDEQFLRAMGANDQEIADVIQAARGAAGPEEGAVRAAAPAADVAEGARSPARADPVEQGQAKPAQVAAEAPTAAGAAPGLAGDAPASVEEGIVRARTRRSPSSASAAAPVQAPVAAIAPAARREKAVRRVEEGKAWFLSRDKAQAFVDTSGIADTHEVVPDKRRFVVRAKATNQQTQPQGGEDVAAARGVRVADDGARGAAGAAPNAAGRPARGAQPNERAGAGGVDSAASVSPVLEAVPDAARAGERQPALSEGPAPAASVDASAHEAATSPRNDTPAPTQAQKEAGNYKMGHLSGDEVQGLRISIENPQGSTRSGTSPDGAEWNNTMAAHYGYVKGTEAADGDHVDVFVGPHAATAPTVYVVDQVNADGSYDEAKALFGFNTKAEAVAAYLGSYDADWKVGPITAMSVDEFKAGLAAGRFKKALSPSLQAVAKPARGVLAKMQKAKATSAPEPAATSQRDEKIVDFGEKIGGARKDRAEKTGARATAATPKDGRPAWARRFEVSQIAKSRDGSEDGHWVIRDSRSLDFMKQARQVGRETYATREEAEAAVPLAAVSLKHRVTFTRDGKFEIWRDVTDRKRVKVVEQSFDTREDALRYLAENAPAIIETNTTFGEADLPRPASEQRIGAARRTGDVKDGDFGDTFGFRGVEFGNWNNQADRQQLLNDAYDGLLDLADVMGIPPRAISLDGELALAFGARGSGLSGARAHYEPEKAVINLTKMNGAGSLAHEWFHAMDHYFGRQDGKAPTEWVTDKDGTRSLKVNSDFERNAASGGTRGERSGMRAEVQDAYRTLMNTITRKAEQYTEDTAKADKFVATSRNEVEIRLASIRKNLSEKLPDYFKRNNKPATAEQLAEFDTLAQQIINGEALELRVQSKNPKAAARLAGFRWTNDVLEKMSGILKAVRGQAGFTADQKGTLDTLRGDMQRYSQRLKMLADAQESTEKTRAVPTSFAMDARELDQGRGQDYWTTPHEMAARAFQGYVEDKIAERGGTSPFLNYGPENAGILTPWGVKRPFPHGAERVAINSALDKLVGVIQTREGEGGNMALFRRSDDGLANMTPAAAEAMRALSRMPYSPRARMQAVESVQKTVDAVRANWANAPDVVVAFDMNDAVVPEAARRADLRQRSGGARGAPEGFYYRGKAYLMASRLASQEDAARVLYHEVLGHHGLRGRFGKQLDGVLNQIATMRRADVDAKIREYGLRGVSKLDRRAAAEEVLAEMAQNTPELHFVRRAVAAIRTWLRAHVPGYRGLRLTDDEIIRNFILPARQFVERGAGATKPGAQLAFSRVEGADVDAESRAFLDGAPVAEMSGKEFASDGVPLTEKVTQFYENTGNTQVDVAGIGLVSLDRQAVKSSLFHGIGRDKATAFAAVPDVLKNGKIIHAEAMEGSRDAGMVYHVAAPVRIGDRDMVEVVLVRADSNAKRMYVHEVVLKEKLRQTAFKTGADAAEAGVQARAGAGAIRSVLDRIYTVNPAGASAATADQTGTPAFRAWFGDSKVVDGEGKPLKAYHGTDQAFTAFDDEFIGEGNGNTDWGNGFYFTDSKQAADGYAQGEEGRTLEVYLSIKNPAPMEVVNEVMEQPGAEMDADYVRQELASRGYDGIIVNHKGGEREFVAFQPTQIKSATGNAGTFDESNPDIMFSRSTVGEYARTAAAELNKTFSAPGRLSWWHKTIGTMYNLAERSPAFKPVFDAAQGFVDDVSHYATDAAELAPKLLPKLETWRDIKKSPISAADNTAVAKPVFEGTLTWARDEQGKPVQVQTLIDAAAGLTAEQKAQRLLRNGQIDERMLKAWQGMPLESYEKAVASRYESRMLQPGVVWSDAELRSIFQLTDDQVALYQEFRDATNRSLDTMARADMLRFAGDDAKGLRAMVMDAPDAQTAAVLIRDHLAQLASDQPDRYTLLMNTANGIIDRADKVRDLQARGYAPLSRFGRYTVDVVDAKGERQYFGLFETAREANTMAANMRGEFGDAAVSQGTLSEEAFKMFAGVTPETLELFGNALGLDSTGDRAQDQAFQEYLKLTKTNRSAMRRLIHRKGIAGFSEDVGRVLASFIYSNSRQTAAGLNMGDLGEAVNAIPKQQGELMDVAVRLAEYVKNPQEEAQAVRGLLFAQYLGGSIASAFVNMTQPAAVTFPWLSQYGGARKAAAALGTAAKNMATRGFEYEPDLAKALKTAEEEGVVSPQEVHQLMAQARGSGSLRAGDGTRLGEARAAGQNALARLSLAWGKVFGAAEQVNRRITFIAAYRVARDRGEADPAAFASRAVKETQFVYSKASKMQWGRGAVGGTLMTFKTYSIAYLELLHRMYTQGGPEGKRAALLALGTLMMMGGSGGLPFAEDLEDVIDGLAQLLGYNFSAKKARQEALEAMLPKGIADFLDKGVSGLPGAPLDVSGRLGMGNLVPGTDLLQQKTSHTRDVLEIAGPAGDFASRIFSGALHVATGHVGAGLLEVSPAAVRNAAKGVDMAATGMYRDAKGYKVLDTNHLEAALKAIGFQPQSVATIQEANSLNQQAKGFYNLRAQEIRGQWAAGIFERDEGKVRDARAAVAEWNAKNPEQPMLMRIPDVMRRVREMQKPKDQRIADTAPRAMRAQMRQDAARAQTSDL